MHTINFHFSAEAETEKKDYSKMTRTEIWKEVVDVLADPSSGMSEEEKQEYTKKIQQKMKSGKRLSSEEMEFLRIHNPQLYRTALRVETKRKALRQRLSHCKSKEEANDAISNEMDALRAMKDDPDKEYMTAMVRYEVDRYRKSSAYARLPEKREDAEKIQGKVKLVQEEKEETEKNPFHAYCLFSRMQMQCERLVQLAKAF